MVNNRSELIYLYVKLEMIDSCIFISNTTLKLQQYDTKILQLKDSIISCFLLIIFFVCIE
jgi:hypothetical protein